MDVGQLILCNIGRFFQNAVRYLQNREMRWNTGNVFLVIFDVKQLQTKGLLYQLNNSNSHATIPVKICFCIKWSYVTRAGIFKQSMGARNRVGIWLSYRTAGCTKKKELALKPNLWTYIFVEFSGHNLDSSQALRIPYTVFTLITSFNPLLLKGGGGIR
jgi:hypothetical protein